MAQQGIRSTYTSVTTEGRLVRVPDDKMMMLESNETALVSFLLGMKKKRVIESPRIEHYEDDFLNQWVVAAATTNANASSTTITLSDGSAVVVGDILMIPSGSSSNHERVRVTAKPSTNVCTVVRNIGSTGLITLTSSAGAVILGQAHEEGSGAPTAKRTTPTLVTNYLQIFKKSTNITGTDAASKQYANSGDERKRQRQKIAKEYKIQKNYQYLWGSPSEDLTGGANSLPIRTTGGLYHHISTNRVDAGGTLTQDMMETFARTAFRYGSKTKLLLAAPMVISAIHMWGNGLLKLEPAAKTFGVDVNKVVTGHGTFILARDWSLQDGVSGQNGLAGYAFAIDFENVTERFLTGRDTWMELDVQPDDEDRHLDLIQGETGLQVANEKTHSLLFGVTGYEK